MTRDSKAYALAMVGWVVTLIVWCLLGSVVSTLLGLSAFITGVLNFIIVFSFCISPVYDRYIDWMEDIALKVLPKDDSV